MKTARIGRINVGFFEGVIYSFSALSMIAIMILLSLVIVQRRHLYKLRMRASDLYQRLESKSIEFENQLETIINNFPDFGAWIYSPNGEPRIISKSFLNLLGMTIEEAANFGWAEHIPVTEREKKVNKWKHCLASGLNWEDEIPIDGADGKRYTLLCQGRPIIGTNGEIQAWIGIKLDITDRVRMEEALRKSENQLKVEKERAEHADRAKSRFLANMSHEIRTPLSAIIGYAELLLDHQQPEESRIGYLHTIIRNGQQLTRIINDILDLSKIESDRFSLEAATFSIEDMLADIQAMLGLQAQAKGLQLVFSSTTPIPKMIQTDQIRVKQILVNLIGNALKFTQRGGVSIKVSAHDMGKTEERTSRLVFDIADTGIGLDPRECRRLFRAFEQINGSRTHGGTGLGLYLARKLAQALGGDVTLLHSQKGVGSLFRADIVVTRASEETFTITSTPAAPRPLSEKAPYTEPGRLDGVRVLVVDDSIDMRLLVKRILQINGAEVECAKDGIEGVTRALREDFDVVIMDIEMPKSDGHEAISKLRQSSYPRPVIALTAHAMSGERERCLSEGFDEYLVKPIQSHAMLSAISNCIERYTRPPNQHPPGTNRNESLNLH